jgi:hypothetical protein
VDVVSLIAKLRSQRESWVEVAPGKRVRVRRPAEAEMSDFRGGMTVDLLCRHVVGWEGVTEADVLGASIGSDEALPFTADLFAEVAKDRLAWFEPIAADLAARIAEHWKTREATAKN